MTEMITVPKRWFEGLLKRAEKVEEELSRAKTMEELKNIQHSNLLIGHCKSAEHFVT